MLGLTLNANSECDVFLQARQPGDVQRNSMVSVFLRMLEYHSGVLFLTTNVVRTLDEAFLSRFSIALTYPDLSKDKRKHIWASFLQLAGVEVEGASKGKAVEGGKQTNGTSSEPKSFISAKYLDRLASKTGFNGELSALVSCSPSPALTTLHHQVGASRISAAPRKR